MAQRISTLDSGYISGDLSLYPETVDTTDSLYEARNNAETVLVQSVSYSSKYLVAESTEKFPESGLIKLGNEIIYYGKKTNILFQDLKRGFAGSKQLHWSKGTKIKLSVFAEMYNSKKDAIIKIETNLGEKDNPESTSLNGILKKQENRFLAPKPLFRAFPRSGPAPLTTKFQNFSSGDPIRFIWDFGDGATSIEENPEHVYAADGNYTVTLNMITSLNAKGIIVKTDYIKVDAEEKPAFFYVTPMVSTTGSEITFIDQTDGDITDRYWIFGDGENETISDADQHTTTHTYSTTGSFSPSLLLVFSDGRNKRLVLEEPIIII